MRTFPFRRIRGVGFLAMLGLFAGCALEPSTPWEWQGCLQRTTPQPSIDECGTVTLLREPADTLNFSLQIRHTIRLSTLLLANGAVLAEEGSMFREGAVWRLQLGVKQPKDPRSVVFTSDDGSITIRLHARGDSLVGNWQRTCLFDECPEAGEVWFIRVAEVE
jgi:hypothetical protein